MNLKVVLLGMLLWATAIIANAEDTDKSTFIINSTKYNTPHITVQNIYNEDDGKLIFTQVVYFEFNEKYKTHTIVDWRILISGSNLKPPVVYPERPKYFSRTNMQEKSFMFFDNSDSCYRKLYFTSLLEIDSLTEDDVESICRNSIFEYHSQSHRKGFEKPFNEYLYKHKKEE